MGKLKIAVELFDDLTEIVFGNIDYRHLPLRVFRGITSMRRIDHDRLAEFPPNGTRRGFGGVGWAQDITDFADGSHAFIHQRDALFRAGFLLLLRRGFRRRPP